MAGYDPKLAAIANDYMRQGYDPETAATLAGIPEQDQSSYIVNDVPGDPNRGFITQTGADRPVDTTATVPTTTNVATGTETSSASGETVATDTAATNVPPSERATSTTGVNDGTYGSGILTAQGGLTSAPNTVLPTASAASGNPIGGLSYDPATQQTVDTTTQNIQSTGIRTNAETTVGNDAFSLVPATDSTAQGVRASAASGLDPRFITTTTEDIEIAALNQSSQVVNNNELAGYGLDDADEVVGITEFSEPVSESDLAGYGLLDADGADFGSGIVSSAEEFEITDLEALDYGNQFGQDDPEDNIRLNTGPDDVNPFDTTGFEERGVPPIELSVDPDVQASLFGSTKNTAQSQGVVRTDQRSTNNRDWRVRLSLAPGADYLYNAAAPGDLLFPLQTTNGIIFPYTPSIQTTYQTTYTKTNLTHSNYLGLFYMNSSIPSVSITATFTAQDTWEAEYLLAVIHFLRSAGKMFYGQDALAGAPPPLLYLSGFGEFQFNDHPCVLENFSYILPQDVDYIRANSVNQTGLNLLQRRKRQTNANPYDGITGALGRLQQLGQGIGRLTGLIKPGANPKTKSTPGRQFELGGDNPTYVPTKMDMTLTLVPVQTRSQISKQFSVDAFARGDLLRGGFW